MVGSAAAIEGDIHRRAYLYAKATTRRISRQ
jgi:hypothetical protein